MAQVSPDDLSARLDLTERRVAEIFDLMRQVCEQLKVSVNEPRPSLRVIAGGR